jgi:hypothetical protein
VPLPEPSRHRLPSSSTPPSPPSVSIGAAPGKAAPAGAGVPTYAGIAFLAVTVRSARTQAGWATLNDDPRTNTAWYGSLHLNTRYLTSAAARRRTACHELGHIVGLDHRRTGKTCMRDGFGTMYGHPDAADYANLRPIYAKARIDTKAW